MIPGVDGLVRSEGISNGVGVTAVRLFAVATTLVLLAHGAGPLAGQVAEIEAFWDFEEFAPGTTSGQLDRIRDRSGNGRDAITAKTEAISYVAGNPEFGQRTAASFQSDTNDVVFFVDGLGIFNDGGPAAGPDINFGANDSFAIEAMVRVPPSFQGVGAIVSKDVAPDQPSWWLRIDGGRLRGLVDDISAFTSVVSGESSINDGEWHHVAFVRDATNAAAKELRLYVDYVLDGVAADRTTGTHANDNFILLGGFNDGNPERQLAGEIDFVRIASDVVSPDQFLRDCIPSETVLCLGDGGRFRVTASFRPPGGSVDAARTLAIPPASSGLVYFFEDDNVELLVKVLDACSFATPGFWVFFAATTNVEFALEVTDTVAEITQTYFNEQGRVAEPVTDFDTFRTCDE
jgi:hypothetical protein